MKRKFISLLITLIMCSCISGNVYAFAPYKNYVPSYQYKTVMGPQAYLPSNFIAIQQSNQLLMPNYTDMATDSNRNIYIIDKSNSILLIYKEVVIDSKVSPFKNPEGLFITPDDMLYIADTGNKRIIELTTDLNVKRVISEPKSELFSEDFVYQPIKLAVDNAKRIYVIAKNENRGLIEFDIDGKFSSFLGAALVTPSLTEIIFKRFASKEMRERMKSFVPTEYNSITLDKDGFLMVTTDSLEADLIVGAINSRSSDPRGTPIRKLNMTGVDILRRTGFRPPVGDVSFNLNDGPSKLCDIVAQNYGIYSVLDNKRCKVFTYDSDGNMLYVFGTKGDVEGTTRNPVALCKFEDKMIVLDGQLGTITEYSLTQYGNMVNSLIAANYDGKYQETIKLSRSLLQLNSNNDLAYDGIAKAAYREGNYIDAYDYAKLANDRLLASKSFKYVRKNAMSKYIGPIIILIFILIILWMIFSLFKFLKNKKNIYNAGRKES